jgi:MoaA/NifB/PqqE/SkfB family radical SAM enzyme
MDVAWDVTSRCNLSCIHCYNSRLYSKGGTAHCGDDLPLAAVKDVMRQMREVQVETVQILGGEPFVRHDFIEILRCAAENGIDCNVATNGVALDSTKIAAVSEIGVRQLAFSIDGADKKSNDYIRGNGSFAKAVANLTLAAEYFAKHGSRTRLGVQCTLNKLNVAEIPSVIGMGKDLRLDFVAFDALKVLEPDIGRRRALSGLALGFHDIFRAVGTIAAAISEESAMSISLLNFGSPKLRQHVNSRYGAGFRVERSCPAASEMLYIRADGRAFPCNYCADFPHALLPRGIAVEDLDAGRTSLTDIVDSAYFRDFYRFCHSGCTYDGLEYCRDCSLYDICEPCPLEVVQWGDKVCAECRAFDDCVRDRQFDLGISE